MNIEVRVLLIAKGNDEPVTEKEYAVRLFDKDIFKKSGFLSSLAKNKKEIFKSRVMKNLDLTNFEEFKMKEGEVVDLGTFLIDAF